MAKTFTTRLTGQVAQQDWFNDLQDSVSVITTQVFNVKESTFGGAVNGSSDDRTPLLNAIAAANSAGGGTVTWNGDLAFTGEIQIPPGVSIGGHGASIVSSSATRLLCLNSAAQLRFMGGHGGYVTNLHVDGNGVSPTPVRVENVVVRVFSGLGISGAAAGGAGLLLAGTQNSPFYGLYINHCAGDGLVLDVLDVGGGATLGPSSNAIHKFEIANVSGYSLRFIKSIGTGTGQPYYNTFRDGLMESVGGPEIPVGIVSHEVGTNNSLADTLLVHGAATSDTSLITLAGGELLLHNVHMQGNTTWVKGITMAANTTVRTSGVLKFQALLYAWYVANSGTSIDIHGGIDLNSVTNEFGTPDTATRDSKLREVTLVKQDQTIDAGGNRAYRLFVTGDSQPRFEWLATGQMQWGSGSATPDTVLSRQAANSLGTASGDTLNAGASLFSRAVTTQTATYTATTSDYYIVMNNSGASATVNLPALGGLLEGHEFLIKRISTQNVVIDPNSTEAFEDAATTKTITTQYGFLCIRKRGTVWDIIGSGGTIT